MSVIIPAILSSSREKIRDELALLHGLVDTVQIDIVDGIFAAPHTWPYTEDKTAGKVIPLSSWGDFRFEADLMVTNPGVAAGTWIESGAQRIVIHVESVKDKLPKVLEEFRRTYGHAKEFAPDLVSLGLGINIETDLASIESAIASADYVQFMGIAHIGAQGQPFDERVLSKIRQFREKYPDTTVQVDGGVSLHNVPDLLMAGADRLVVGSALWKCDDIPGTLRKFNEMVTRSR